MNQEKLDQLKRALDAGIIDQDTYESAIAGINAQLTGSGAIAQGKNAIAAGQGGVVVDGDNSGPINTGVQVLNGHYISRDYIQVVTQVVKNGEDAEEAKSVIAFYLHALANDLAGLRLGDIDASAAETRKEPLQLADVYVPLNTTHNIPESTTLAEWLSSDRLERREEMGKERKTRPVTALEALAAHRELTVLGKPGSGKSTFGASVLLALAQAWQGHREQLSELGETWKHGTLLPIRVILRRFAEQLPSGDQPARAGDLWRFIACDLDASGYGLSAQAMDYVQRIARTTGALVLLDGLDECGSMATRERVLAGVRELMGSAGPQCRFILTARPYAWPNGPVPAEGVYGLADFDDAQIEHFIRAWYAALVKRNWRIPGEAERKMNDLLEARRRPDLLPIAQNPLLLTLMATLHTNRGRLPDDRADLYNESVELLLQRWNQQIGADAALLDALAIPGLKLSDLREVLEELAFNVHEQNVGKEGTADIGEDRLARAFRPLLNNSKDKADVVVDYIEKRAGLLVGRGEKDGERQFAFPHRTFQEFLAASYLAARDDLPAECARLGRAAPGHWQVVLPLAARLAKAERGTSAADELISGISIAELRSQRQPEAADWRCALLAGMQLQEIGMGTVNKRPRTLAIARRVADWLVASLPLHPDDGGLPARERAQAGDVLAAIGDPRFDLQRFYLPADASLGFAHIAADAQFKIGTRNRDKEQVKHATGYAASDDEINDAFTPTPEFYIGRYPVTVAQFRAFVEATGFEPGDADALRGPNSRPVRWVSWHEARAFCDWLNELLCNTAAFEKSEIARLVRERGWRVDLPSELEWEKAARGGLSDAVFSWGDAADPERANYDETEIGTTSSVGCFPANSFGLHDMIGNVWEWTRSLWGKDPQKPDFDYPYDTMDQTREDLCAGDDVYRVVRGGSWDFRRVSARCAYRNWYLPGYRSYDFGFRVVLRSAPVS